MPNFVRKFFLQFLARKIGIQGVSKEYSFNELQSLRNSNAMLHRLSMGDVFHADGGRKKGLNMSMERNLLEEILREISLLTSYCRDQHTQDEIEEEWQLLGKVMDRLFFFVFLFMFIITSIVVLYPVIYSHH